MGKISEIFSSVQGEGLYCGRRQIFVRFFGCNLSCKFCDTRLNNFEGFSPYRLLAELKKYPEDFHSISFTGGEPLLQKEFLGEVLKLTKERGIVNYLETNGTLPDALDEVIDLVDIVAMDLKLPSSTGLVSFWKEHRRFLKIASRKEVFLKAVICKSTTGDDIREAIKLIKGTNKDAVLVLQPNTEEYDAQLKNKIEKCRKACVDAHIKVKVIPQMHKLLGVK
ncbi:MAG: 7-carboxy-7-deazaguanine synthase QueE [Deltaproteobacteria bacterium]